MKRQVTGFTMLEVLIVVALVAIVGTISIFNSRNLLQGEQANGAAVAFQQMLWQASTTASARFEPMILSYKNKTFTLTGQTSKKVIRTELLPQSVKSSFPTNLTLVFTPTGRIDQASYAAFQNLQPVTITGKRSTYRISFTIIGESRVVLSK